MNANSNVRPFSAIKPGHRLVPAKVGHNEQTSVIVYVECPNWCTEDHVADPVRNVEDVMHRGDMATLDIPTFGYGAYPIQLFAAVECDPVAKDSQFRAAHVTVQDNGGNAYCHLTPDMAEAMADAVIGFASELRHQARTARLANESNGQVREGGVA